MLRVGFSALILCFGLHTALVADAAFTINKNLVPRGPWKCDPQTKQTTESLMSCLEKHLDRDLLVLVFDRQTRDCCSVAAPLANWIWQLGKKGLDSSDSKDTLFLKKTDEKKNEKLISSLAAPKIFWLFDSNYKTKNLGTGGQKMDGKATGVRYIALGPSEMTGNSSANPTRFAYFMNATVRVPSYNLNTINGLTIASWVKFQIGSSPFVTFERKLHIFQKFWTIASAYLWNYGKRMMFSTGGTNNLQSLSTMSLATWHHMAAVFLNPRKFWLFIDGKKVEAKYEFKDAPFGKGMTMNIGTFKVLGVSYNFVGCVACFTIYEKALSESEVRVLMNMCN